MVENGERGGGNDAATREEELERFREAWRAEVRQKNGHARSASSDGPSSGGHRAELGSVEDQAYWGPSTSSAELELALEKLSIPPRPSIRASEGVRPQLASTTRAVEFYHQAVECEQQGRLDDALALYRRSFKLDSNVDKAYHRFVAQESAPPPSTTTQDRRQGIVLPVLQPVSTSVISSNRSNRSLHQIIAGFAPRPVAFIAEDERLPNPLEGLPDEIILHILMLLAYEKDVSTIECFATINLKARLLAADSSVWRLICQDTYVPPQVQQDLSAGEVASLYGYNYRHTFINHPRVRLDGCYIAVCHYIRPGQSENAWVAIRHLITYHRLLRFFADGTVVCLLTNEEKPLAEMVHLLKPTIRIKGSQIGNWALDDARRRLSIRNLRPPELGGRTLLKYEFAMDLNLTSAHNKRWNKLEMDWYASVNTDTGEIQHLPIKRERPFYFSKVRSYTV